MVVVPPSSSNVLYNVMHLFNDGVSTLREHSWWICCVLLALYIVREQGALLFFQALGLSAPAMSTRTILIVGWQ
jgi:hypothetical protein